MACPYFYPVAPLTTNYWAVAPRLPLGDTYAGECRAQTPSSLPDEQTARKFCNVGYGRGCCERFPGESPADAVRFHIAAETPASIRIQYVLEKDCWPREHGTVECSLRSRELSGGETGEILRKQIGAFVDSQLGRRSR